MLKTPGIAEYMPDVCQEATLRPTRVKEILSLAFLAFLLAVGISAVARGLHVYGWPIIAFSLVCAAVFAIQTRPHAFYLRLSAKGFYECTLSRERFQHPWTDIVDFRVVQRKHHGIPIRKAVVYDLTPSRRAGWAQKAARFVEGADGRLMDNYGLKADDLAGLMNAWREFHTSGVSAP